MNIILCIIPVIVLGTLILIVRSEFYITVIDGNSMQPFLYSGDRVLALRYWPMKWLKNGDVVIVQRSYNEAQEIYSPRLIKRIIGLPGDTVYVTSNEMEGEQERDQQSFVGLSTNLQGPTSWHVPINHYFLQGDSAGVDSRIWGPLPFRTFLGIVILKFPNKQMQ